MPLSGGATDKAGNSYERRWTVFSLLDILDGRAQSIRIEVPGEEGVGAEFRLATGPTQEWHQAKRQRDGGPWTIASMANEGVLGPMLAKIRDGGRCVFVSSTGAQELRELVERADDAESWDEFEREFLTDQQVPRFQRLRSAWGDIPESEVYEALQAVQVRLIGEPELAGYIDARLTSIVAGEPSAAAAVLAQLADDSRHQLITSAEILGCLAANGIAPRNLSQDAEVVGRLAETVELYLRRLRPLYIAGTELTRTESITAFERLSEGTRVLVAGSAGHGKSVILGHVTDLARSAGWTVLVISADRLPPVDTLLALGKELGLPDSPATVLAGAAGGGDAMLVVDQLDAVSVASGRHSERIGVVQDLLASAARYPSVRVLLACRQFDLDNDRQLRVTAADEQTTVVNAGPLEESAVIATLESVDLSAGLTQRLIGLLTVPLHLALYVELGRRGADLTDITTLTDLFDRYWEMKRLACATSRNGVDQWLEVVDRLVDRMSSNQQLGVPAPALDDLSSHLSVMLSENVLTSQHHQIAFFHETFFDYCFARRFIARGGSLRDLLVTSEQDLFRRAQVRQLLIYERTTDPSSYIADITWILASDQVRAHLKVLVVALIASMGDPTSEEWDVLRSIASDSSHQLHNRLWVALRRNPAWFPVLQSSGDWTEWISSEQPELVDLALWALSGMAEHHPVGVAEVLSDLLKDSAYPARIRGFLRMAKTHGSRSLFELLLDAVRSGYYDADQGRDLWYILADLAEREPVWAVEIVAELVKRGLDSDPTDPFDAVESLRFGHDSLGDEVVAQIARTAPAAYVEQLLPLILEVVHRNSRPEWSGGDVLLDAVWGMHIYRASTGLKHDLYSGMATALATLAEVEPARASAAFELLKDDSHESAWFLLAQGYQGNPAYFAGEAAEWIAETPGALHLGYSDSDHWVSRELLGSITPHCTDAELEKLVSVLIGYTPPFERTYEALRYRGVGELCLLNGIDSGRRPERAARRLAELRRKFLRDDVDPPQGITGGIVPPPIPEDRARKMTNAQWLRAMTRHGEEESPFRRGRFMGDATTQAQVLEKVASESPERFARLLLGMEENVAVPYVSALLRGLRGTRLEVALVEAVCIHARQRNDSDVNRWVANLIESEAAASLPSTLIDMLSDIVMSDPDPTRDTWVPTEDDPTAYYGGTPDGAGLNCTRGAAAGAIGSLVREDASRLDALRPALDSACHDPTVQVRVMAIASLVFILFVDDDLALELFRSSIEGIEDQILNSQYVERFLNIAIRRGHYEVVSDVLAGMRGSPDENLRRMAARQLAVASYRDAALDPLVDEALVGDDALRAGVVEVFADNPTTDRYDRRMVVLGAALDDISKDVRSSALRAFYRIEDERVEDYAPLIGRLATSAALEDHSGAVFHSLEAVRQPLPPIVLDLCEAFVDRHAASIGDIATGAAGDAMSVAKLVIRLHAQNQDPEMRRRCLDLIDKLVVSGAHGIDEDLANVER